MFNSFKYIEELKKKAEEFDDTSLDIESQKIVEEYILLKLVQIRNILNSEKISYSLILNENRWILKFDSPISFFCDTSKNKFNDFNKKEKDVLTLIEEIIYVVNNYSDDKYFTLMYEEYEGKYIISFQNRFWLSNVVNKINHIEEYIE